MNNIIFTGGNKKVKIKCDDLSLRDFHNRRNKVLILRDTGGLGDVLMMRMIFASFKNLMPEAEISFAIPINYHKAAVHHPHIKDILNSKDIDENKFGISYNLTTTCVRYETKIRPRADRHRAEIWANYCGLELDETNMFLNFPDKIIEYSKRKLHERIPRKNGYVCFTPISNMVSKDLNEKQINEVLISLEQLGYSPYILHHMPIPYVNCPVMTGTLDEWVGLLNASDYVISVDTAAFHAANGLNKPTVAIFSWADGKVYTKFHQKCILIQRHRDYTPGWTCGPCYNHNACPKTNEARKPCTTEITSKEIIEAFIKLTKQYEKS